MTKRIGQTLAYIRVSTEDQNDDRQQDLTADADKVFKEKASSSKDRPELERLLDYARDGDHIIVWSIDRFARSLRDLKNMVYDLTEKGVSIEFKSERLTFSPSGDGNLYSELMLNLLGSIYEFERKMLLQRQKEGIAKAKAAGKYKGRAKALSSEQVFDARSRIASQVPKAVVARDLGVSRSTLYRALAEVQS